MHYCPECGEDCDCDGEDIWKYLDSLAASLCTHNCEVYWDNDDWDEEEGEELENGNDE